MDVTGFPWSIPKLKKGEVIAIDDIQLLPEDASAFRELLTQQNIKSCTLMPIRPETQVSGFIGFDNTLEVRPWSKEDLALLRVSANILGSALTRQKYELAERKARRSSDVLRKAMLALSEDLEVDVVLEKLLYYLADLIPYDSACVLLFEKDRLTLKAGRGFPNGKTLVGQSFPASNRLFQDSRSSGAPIILQDAQEDPRFERWGGFDYVRGWIGLPLKAREDILGYLTIDSKEPGKYTEEDAELAQTFAAQAAIAIENAQLYVELQELAALDPLTGLKNRRHFFELATKEFSRAQRYHRHLTAIMLDIDQFKLVNDNYGHHVGDAVLMELSQLLMAEFRNNDIIARYGGEEFVILLPETDLNFGIEVAERVREKLERNEFETGNGSVRITGSLGAAALHKDWGSIDQLLQHADSALYIAKAKGRNRVERWAEQ